MVPAQVLRMPLAPFDRQDRPNLQLPTDNLRKRLYNAPMRKWLARLSFSFIILAVLLVWDAYRALRGYGRVLPAWQIYLEFAAAVLSFALGMVGVRERHRPTREHDDQQP